MSERLRVQIIDQLRSLPAEQQRRVLDFVQALALSTPVGVAGKELLPFAGTIGAEDLRLMAQAIDEGCEQVDPHEW